MAKIFDFKNEYGGLSSERAAEHIKLYGYNSNTKLDEKEKGYNPLNAILSLRFILMIAASLLSIIYGLIGHAGIDWGKIVSGILLLIFAIGAAAWEISHNTRCDEYFFELKRKSKTEFKVVRDGQMQPLKREHLVPDDIMILEEGEYVPADAHLLEIEDLTVDESIFTNDKTPVRKITGADSLSEELKKSCVYKGTKIVTGRLVARVTATGVDTKHFKAFGAPKETDEYYTALEKLVLRVSNICTVIAGVMLLCSVLLRFAGINIYADNPMLETLYSTCYPAIAFAMCFIPAPAASIVRSYYIAGAKALEEKNIRIKNLSTLEHMNAATCILIDKSGTVTKNRMSVADILTQNPAMMTNVSVLACSKDPTDPADQAIILDATFKGYDAAALHENELIHEYPFDETEGAAGNLWNVNGTRLLCIKGAPDKLLPLCDVPNDMLYSVQNKQVSFGQQGYNVLSVAFAQLDEEGGVPKKISDIRYTFMGLVAFENQTRDYIPAAVRNCQRAGVRVIMTTGDSPETALAVARKIGIKGGAITGAELLDSNMSDLSDIGVFARVTADKKPEIIKRLQRSGEIVMITGESATDSNLLELSDVGISLARNVSGAAFEACDVIMSDDSFETVVDALRVSRQMHGNVRRAIFMSFTALAAMALFALVNLLLGTEFMLTPVLCALISSAAVPAMMLMFMRNNADSKSVMSPSVYIGRGSLRKSRIIRPLVQALGLAAAEVMFYLISSGYGSQTEETVQKLTESCRSNFLLIFVFGLLLSGWINLTDRGVIYSFRSGQSYAWLVTGIVIFAAIMLVFVPMVNYAFGFGSVDVMMLFIAFAVTLFFQLPVELFKLGRRNSRQS